MYVRMCFNKTSKTTFSYFMISESSCNCVTAMNGTRFFKILCSNDFLNQKYRNIMTKKYPLHLVKTRNAVEIVGNVKIIGCMIHVDL